MNSRHSKETPSPTLADVARRVGVSSMTVSRALRGAPRVSAATVEKVRAAATELGYRPNPLVQTLMSGVRSGRAEATANIAWVSTYPPDKLPEALRRIEAAALARAEDLGYSMDRFELSDPGLTAPRIEKIFHARGILGAVVGPLRNPGTELDLPWDAFAFATVGKSLVSPRLSYAMPHHYHGMETLLDKLEERGYRRIGLLLSRQMDERSDHAPTMVFEHRRLLSKPRRLLPSRYYDGWSEADFKAWADHEKPDAIIADYSWILSRLRNSGLEIPGKIGFASMSWWAHIPECSGMRLRFRAIAAAAIDLVINQLHRNERGIPEVPKAVLLENEWIQGTTLRSSSF